MKSIAKTIVVIVFIRAYEPSLEFAQGIPDRKIHQVP